MICVIKLARAAGLKLMAGITQAAKPQQACTAAGVCIKHTPLSDMQCCMLALSRSILCWPPCGDHQAVCPRVALMIYAAIS